MMSELNQIKKLYEDGFSSREIAKKLGTSKSRISSICQKHGFVKSVLNPTDYQMQIIYGSIIGDGSLNKSTPNSNAKFTMGHSLKQIEYFMFKYNSVLNLVKCKTVLYSHFDKRTQKTYESIHFQSKVNRLYTELHSKWYKDGKKIMPIEELLKLDKLAIAIKYFDDGYKNSGGNYNIAMHDYSVECIDNFRDLLRVKFGIDTNMHKSKTIYILAKDRDKFKEIISVIKCKDIQYKI
uniref:Homing endonuclease with LAGLIDADG motif n=2 Tax=unclassified bacterial viruses TaxID=12333 RepID=A0AAU8KW68_9VIRU